MTGLRVALMACVLSAGCALSPRAPGRTTWTFPPRYRALQVVSVALPDGQRDFLASVIRADHRIDVVLFEPALMVPLISASGGDRPASEIVFLEGIPPGQGVRLVHLLATMHSIIFDIREGPTTTGARAGFRFTLKDFESVAGCRFPRVVEVDPAMGGPAILVRITDVTCDGDALPGSPR